MPARPGPSCRTVANETMPTEVQVGLLCSQLQVPCPTHGLGERAGLALTHQRKLDLKHMPLKGKSLGTFAPHSQEGGLCPLPAVLHCSGLLHSAGPTLCFGSFDKEEDEWPSPLRN